MRPRGWVSARCRVDFGRRGEDARYFPSRKPHRRDSWLLPGTWGHSWWYTHVWGSPRLTLRPSGQAAEPRESLCSGDPSPQGRPAVLLHAVHGGLWSRPHSDQSPLLPLPRLLLSRPPLGPAPLPAQPPAPRSLLGPLAPDTLAWAPLLFPGPQGTAVSMCVCGGGSGQRQELPGRGASSRPSKKEAGGM